MPGFSPPSGAARNLHVVILGRRRIGILDVSTGSLSAGRIQVLSAETVLHNRHGPYPSDHYPVAARIEIGP